MISLWGRRETHAIRAGRPKETPCGSFSASWRRTTLKKHSPTTRDLSPSLDRVRSKTDISRRKKFSLSLEIFKNFCSFEKFPEARCVCVCALFDRPTTTTTTRRKKRLRKKNTTTTHHVQQVHPHRHVPVASVVVEPGASQHQRHERHVRGVHRLQREPVGGALKVRIGD